MAGVTPVKKEHRSRVMARGRANRLLCKLGYHIPVKMVDEKSGNFEVFCQECARDLPESAHDKFFEVKE